MSEVQGVVERIWHNERADGSKYWVLAIGGKRYSTWDRQLIENIREGDTVGFAFTHSGRYRNLTALRRSPGPSIITTGTLVRVPEALRATRMSCLRAAAELLKETTLLPEQRLSLAITLAERMEEYVLRHGKETGNAHMQQCAKERTECKDTGEGEHGR